MNTEEEKKDELSSDSVKVADQEKMTSQTVSPEEINELESSAATKNDPSSTNEITKIPHKKKGNFVNKGSKFKRRAGLISLGTSLIGVLGLVASLFLGPLKLSVMLQGIESRHFASSTFASESYGERLVSSYIKKTVLPNLSDRCPSSIAVRTCAPNVGGENGPVKRLFQSWKNNNFEGMLAERGLEIQKKGNNYHVLIDKKPGFDIPDSADIERISITGGRKEARKAITTALEKDLHADSALKRHRMGGFIQKKYGIKRCMFACDLRDDYADWKGQTHTAFKMKLIERVVEPRSQYAAILFSCMSGVDCDTKSNANDPDGGDAFSKKIELKMEEYVRAHGAKAEARLEKTLGFIKELNEGKGLTRLIVEKSFSKILGEGAGKTAGQLMGPIGWINTAASIVVALDSASKLKKWIFSVNSAAVVGFYMNYRTLVDEVNSGSIEPETLGSFVSALGSENGASAEQSPLYADYFINNSTAGKITSFFSPHVLAEGEVGDSSSDVYTCNNGDSVYQAQDGNGKICPEDSLNTNNKLSQATEKITNNPAFGSINALARGFKKITNVGGFTITLLEKTPVLGDGIKSGTEILANSVSEITQPALDIVKDYVVPPIIPDDVDKMSGAKNFTLLAAGANAAGNEFSHYGLGGQVLSDQEAYAIYQEVQKEEGERFASLPIKEKLFSTVEGRSFISQLAMMTPFDSQSPTKMASIIARIPIKTLGSTARLISTIGVQKVKAEEPYKDPFGITQYGYPKDFDFEKIDPSTLTDEACANIDKDWVSKGTSSQTKDPNNGTDIHNSVNICRLNEALVTGLGAVFGVIEKNSIPSSLTGGDNSSSSSQVPTSLNIVYGDTTDIPCKAGQDGGIKDGYLEGKLYNIRICYVRGVDVNSQISGQVDQIFREADSSGIDLFTRSGGYRTSQEQQDLRIENGCPDFTSSSSTCRIPTAPVGWSNHQMGLAIDFGCNGATSNVQSDWQTDSNYLKCWQWLNDNLPRIGLKNLDGERWHWSTDGR